MVTLPTYLPTYLPKYFYFIDFKMISRQFGEKFYRILILVWKPYFETQLPPKNDFAVIHLKKALDKILS